jgi:hypothetical protein
MNGRIQTLVVTSATIAILSLSALASAGLIVEIQPIQVREDDGTNPTFVTLPEAGLDAIFGQAGIDIHFLPTTTLDSTEFRILDSGEGSLLFVGANGQNVDPLVLNLWFTQGVGLPPPVPGSVVGAGVAFIGGNGMWVHGPGLMFATDEFSSSLIGHFIGHNLGLAHTSTPIPGNLMNDRRVADIGPGLTDEQIAAMLASQFVQNVPDSSIPTPSTLLLFSLGFAALSGHRCLRND